jgi:hypothetical protein
MGEAARSAFESVAGKLLDEKRREKFERPARRVRLGIFVISAVVVSLLFIRVNGAAGWIMAGVPLVLLGITYRYGIGSLPSLVIGVAGVAVLIPAFFFGMYYSDKENLTNLILVGYLVFFAWVTTYPLVLTDAEQHFARTNYGPDVKISELAEYRILVIKLWMATATMLAVDAGLPAFICICALGWIARWTAAVAAVTCFAGTVVTFEHGQIGWKEEGAFAFVVALVAGFLAAKEWMTAMRDPGWYGHGWLRVVLTWFWRLRRL